MGRLFRNMAVINTHPALQLDRSALAAARANLGAGGPPNFGGIEGPAAAALTETRSAN